MGVTASWKLIWPGEGWPEPAAAGAARSTAATAVHDGPAHDRVAMLRFVPNMASASRFLALWLSWSPGKPPGRPGVPAQGYPRKSRPRPFPAARPPRRWLPRAATSAAQREIRSTPPPNSNPQNRSRARRCGITTREVYACCHLIAALPVHRLQAPAETVAAARNLAEFISESAARSAVG